MSYANFRSQNNDINAIKDKFNSLDGKKVFNDDLDETYWTPNHVAGPEGMGEAIIRFLPAPPDGNGGQEPDHVVKYVQYSVRTNGKTYINKGRNSLGADEKDPANDYNRSIWQRTDLTKDEKKKLLINRSEYYITNIFVVKDPNKPENEGKVFRYKFGRQVYNIYNEQLFPKFETDPPCVVYDPIEGADFILRVTPRVIPDSMTGEKKTVPTYEHSKFSASSQRWSLEEFDKIWAQEYSLQSEIAPDKFRPYEDLKRQFDRVMGIGDDEDDFPPALRAKEVSKSKPAEQIQTKQVAPKEESKPLTEELDDEVPWFTDNEENSSETANSNTSSENEKSEIDDWFSNLGN